MRRDHLKYLNLINTIALLHQHQRVIHNVDGEESINVERSDIVVANKLAGEILGQSLDELSPQTRRLLQPIHEFVASESKTKTSAVTPSGSRVETSVRPRSGVTFRFTNI